MQIKCPKNCKKNRDYLELLIDSIPDAVFSVRLPERTIEWARDTQNVLGVDLEAFIGTTTQGLYSSVAEYRAFGKILEKAVRDNKTVIIAETMLRNKSGESVPVEINTTIYREKGEPVRVISLVRDISWRKKIQVALENSEARLKEAQRQDRPRLKVFGGTGEFNLKYYGIGPDSIFQKFPLEYNIEANAYMWQVSGEPVKGTSWYLGLRHMYSVARITFELSHIIDFLPDIKGEVTTSGLGLVVTYDDRDNSYYPTQGIYLESVYSLDDPDWGSDFTFSKWTAFYNHYLSVTDNGVIALRLDLGSADGDIPFYMLPSLSMRGFAAGRYCDNTALSGHVEWRHKILPRWGYLLSYEAGYTHDTLDGIFEGRFAYSVGAGIRWQVIRTEALHLGLDFGINEDDSSVCVQVGERF